MGKRTVIKRQKKRPKSGAERAKNYRKRQKKAFEDNKMNRVQLKNYLKEKNRRSIKNKPKTCKTTRTTSMTATIEWMNESNTIQDIKYKRLNTHMRHACTPSFVTGNSDPMTAEDSGNREVYFLDDNNRWRHWLDKQKSSIAGFGIFAARLFRPGEICTRYMGKKTSSVAVSKRMLKKSKGYVFKFQTSNNKEMWVAPDLSKSYMYGHFLNHSNEPNCVVDKLSGIITTIYQINKGDELTIDYGKDYDWRT
jgi:hypothetical protein